MRAAAEAVKEALVLDDVEGRRLLVMERAKAAVLAAAPGQPHAPANQFAERDAAAQFVEKSRRKGHAAGSAQQLFHDGAGAAQVDDSGVALAQGRHDASHVLRSLRAQL